MRFNEVDDNRKIMFNSLSQPYESKLPRYQNYKFDQCQ